MLYSCPPERHFTPSPHRPPPAFLFPNPNPSSAASKHKLYSFRLGSNTVYATPRNAMCSSGLFFSLPSHGYIATLIYHPCHRVSPPIFTFLLQSLYFLRAIYMPLSRDIIFVNASICYSSSTSPSSDPDRVSHALPCPSPYPFSPYRLANITPAPNYPKPPPSPHHPSEHINRPFSRTL
jgi:hypothetical protein